MNTLLRSRRIFRRRAARGARLPRAGREDPEEIAIIERRRGHCFCRRIRRVAVCHPAGSGTRGRAWFCRAERGSRRRSVPLSVLYTNSSTVALRNASLAITLPDGVFFSGQSQREQTGDDAGWRCRCGKFKQYGCRAPRDGGRENVVQVSLTLSYATDASHGALFATSYQGNVTVDPPVIGLKISAPTNVFAGQDFEVNVSYQNTTNQTIDGIGITMHIPWSLHLSRHHSRPRFPGKKDVWSRSQGAMPASPADCLATAENAAPAGLALPVSWPARPLGLCVIRARSRRRRGRREPPKRKS